MALTDLICSYYTVAGVSPAAGGASPIPFESRVRACAEAGYVGMGVHLRDYSEMRREGITDETLRAILRDHGMRHVEVEFLQDWFADGEAGERSRRAEETLYHMTEALGARVMFLTGDLKPDADLPFDQLQERFSALCARAAERGATIGVEPCAWSNIGDAETGLRLIEGAGAANAGLFLDVWHLYRRGLDYEKLRAIPAERVIGVQLDDAAVAIQGTLVEDCLNHRLPPGQGAAGTVAFIRVLAEMGVDVPMSVELISDAQRARSLKEAARFSFETAKSATKAALSALRLSR
jgi:sugar phosphate isomerase/epimerase